MIKVIAEIGINHESSVDIAKNLLDSLKSQIVGQLNFNTEASIIFTVVQMK